MAHLPGPLEALIRALKRLPGVGEKTATRFSFHILNASAEEVRELTRSIEDVKLRLKLCSICFNLAEADTCSVCSDARRDLSRICVVETPVDLMSVEKSGEFRGVYHVLHGLLAPLESIGPDDIRMAELVGRAKQEGVKEVILALNPTVEGESTSSFIRDQLRATGVTVSRIAYGIPVGGSLEYTDPLTLTRALENRKEL
ncbi:MAG: recombination mediator RecR [Thermodesulfobacteriota bacterium]